MRSWYIQYIQTYWVSPMQAIAALYCNTTQMVSLLETTRFPSSPEPITSQFFRQWINDAALFEGSANQSLCPCLFCNSNERAEQVVRRADFSWCFSYKYYPTQSTLCCCAPSLVIVMFLWHYGTSQLTIHYARGLLVYYNVALVW